MTQCPVCDGDRERCIRTRSCDRFWEEQEWEALFAASDDGTPTDPPRYSAEDIAKQRAFVARVCHQCGFRFDDALHDPEETVLHDHKFVPVPASGDTEPVRCLVCDGDRETCIDTIACDRFWEEGEMAENQPYYDPELEDFMDAPAGPLPTPEPEGTPALSFAQQDEREWAWIEYDNSLGRMSDRARIEAAIRAPAEAELQRAQRARDAALSSRDDARDRADRAEAELQRARREQVTEYHEQYLGSERRVAYWVEQLQQAREALQDLLAIIDHVGLQDARNGVTDSTGSIDEGETKVYTMIGKARALATPLEDTKR